MRRFTAFVLGLCLSLPVLAEQVQRFTVTDTRAAPRRTCLSVS